MADLRLQRRHRHLRRVFSQHQLQRPGLDAIVQLGRSSVQIHVVHIGARRSRLLSSPGRSLGPAPRRTPAVALDGRPRRSSRSRQISARIFAPRACACSYSSSTNIHAPSATTNPSRSTENGREPRSGSWFQESVRIFIRMKPFTMPSEMGASAPPLNDHVEPSGLNLAHRISEGVGRRSAAGSDHVTGPAQPEAHAKLAGQSSHHSGGHTEQTHLACIAGEKTTGIVLR